MLRGLWFVRRELDNNSPRPFTFFSAFRKQVGDANDLASIGFVTTHGKAIPFWGDDMPMACEGGGFRDRHALRFDIWGDEPRTAFYAPNLGLTSGQTMRLWRYWHITPLQSSLAGVKSAHLLFG